MVQIFIQLLFLAAWTNACNSLSRIYHNANHSIHTELIVELGGIEPRESYAVLLSDSGLRRVITANCYCNDFYMTYCHLVLLLLLLLSPLPTLSVSSIHKNPLGLPMTPILQLSFIDRISIVGHIVS